VSTRDELIEALAAIEHGEEEGLFGPAFDQLDEEERQEYRDHILLFWPVIVGFVAEWMEGFEPWQRSAESNRRMVHAWRDEMTQPASASRGEGDPARAGIG
jgi:hypothetical protein